MDDYAASQTPFASRHRTQPKPLEVHAWPHVVRMYHLDEFINHHLRNQHGCQYRCRYTADPDDNPREWRERGIESVEVVRRPLTEGEKNQMTEMIEEWGAPGRSKRGSEKAGEYCPASLETIMAHLANEGKVEPMEELLIYVVW